MRIRLPVRRRPSSALPRPRRITVAGAVLAASVAAFSALPAAAAPPAQCWTPESYALQPGERTPRRATAADRVSQPPPAVAGPAVTGPLSGVIRRVDLPKGVKLVALTFDLCETGGQVAGYDGPIFDTLRKEGVPATFFAGGKWLETHPERARQIAADPLFEIGNHSWDHANLHAADDSRMSREILTAQAAIDAAKTASVAACPAATPVSKLSLFRFPYGSCSAASLAAANANGEVVIQWDVVSGDPADIGAKAIADNVMRQVHPGSIIVMHANGNGKHTREGLPLVIARLKAAGYGFATVSDLIAAGKPVAASSCYIDHPGDTARYDRIADAKAAKASQAKASGDKASGDTATAIVKAAAPASGASGAVPAAQ